MKTQKTSKPKSHVMVTLPPALRKEVERLAEQEDRPMAYVCRRFIEEGLANAKATRWTG